MYLSEYPFDHVRLACEKCDRAGSYRKIGLLDRYGDIRLPDLRLEIAADCPRNNGIQPAGLEQCGVIYPDLLASARSQ